MNQFSIILPVRNGGEYVKECVNSILNQTYSNFNLIVLDNNSSDGTKEWIESLHNDKVIIYPSTRDLSITENWARAVDVTKNEFMTLIGHDDVLYPNFLQEINNLIEKYPDASLYQSHFDYIDGKGELIRKCKEMSEIQNVSEFLKCQFLQTLDSMGTGYTFRTKDYQILGGMPTNYENLIFADYELWVRLINIKYKATTLENCFGYRIHNNTSKTTNGELYQSTFNKYIHFLTELRKDRSVANIIDKYGKIFLLYFCESLSHRILKTAKSERKVTVWAFVQNCNKLGSSFIPKESFSPLLKVKIFAAVVLDNFVGRLIFSFYKKNTTSN